MRSTSSFLACVMSHFNTATPMRYCLTCYSTIEVENGLGPRSVCAPSKIESMWQKNW